MVRLIAIYMNNSILYKDNVISLSNNQVSKITDLHETLLNVETNLPIMNELIKELDGVCKGPTTVVSQCKPGENNLCCVQNILQVKGGGGRGNRSGGVGPGPEPQEIKLIFEYKTKGVVSVSLSPSGEVEVTTHISDLQPDIMGSIKYIFENEIKSSLSLFANTLSPIYVKNAIESFFGIQKLNQVILHNKNDFHENTVLDKLFANLSQNNSIKNKVQCYKNIFEYIHENKTNLNTKQPSQTPRLIKYSSIYHVIANLIDNAIEKCIEETEQKNLMWPRSACYEIFKATLELHNDQGEKINLFSASSGNSGGSFEFFHVLFPESHPTSSFMYVKASQTFYLKKNGEQKEIKKNELKKALQDVIYPMTLANISKLDKFTGLEVVISNKYPERLHRKVFEDIVIATNKSLQELEGVLNESKQGLEGAPKQGGSSKKVRLNEYIMVNGRKKRLYKGERGGLYTMEKSGVFKRVPKDSY